jgi:hypothetical protein
LICVHDADQGGHDIYQTLREGNDGKWIDVKDIGLSLTEAVDLGLEFEEITDNQPKKFPEKLINNLPDNELLLLTGKTKERLRKEKVTTHKRVELNAMTPEVFLRWLEGKLRELGIEGKVRPPDEVVSSLGREATERKLKEIIKAEVERAVGVREIVDSCMKSMMMKSSISDCSVKLDEVLETFPTDGWREIVEKQSEQHAEDLARASDIKHLVASELTKHLSFFRETTE